MEKIPVSAFLLLVALSYTLAKDTTVKPGAKKDTKDSQFKLPQTLSRGWGTNSSGPRHMKKLYTNPRQALKKAFAENREIQKLAEQFVLLNLVYETTDKHLSLMASTCPGFCLLVCYEYGLKGKKIKGAMLLPATDPSLTVRADITGRYSNRLYAYEPSDTALLLDNMKKALKLLKTEL